MSDATPKPIPTEAPSAAERSTDFRTYYANNILFESTAWDMKLTFGHIDRATAPLLVMNDCSVTIPWPQAKLALFWLRLHVEMAEAEIEGKIPIRKDLLPLELPETLSGLDEVAAQRFREVYQRIRAEFLKMT